MPRYTREELAKMRRDGRRGGKLAAERMSADQRQERARKAAQARWARSKPSEAVQQTDGSQTIETTSNSTESH